MSIPALPRVVFLAILVGLIPTAAVAADAPKGFRAGAFAQDITPLKFPISVNGNMRDVQATTVHDRLHARCLVLDDGTTTLAIAVVDNCLILREILDDAKARAHRATGIPIAHMLISATHTHTAPTVTPAFLSEPDADYTKFLATRIAEGITRAHKNLAPAKAGWAVGKEPNQVFNRRWHMKPGTGRPNPFGTGIDTVTMNPGYQHPGLLRPAGPTDPDVSVLSIESADGRPIALLANYSLHYVGGVPPLSADYFGAFAERVTQLIGATRSDPPFVGIMSNGTSGDINNVNFAGPPPGKREPFEQIKVVADAVARVAVAARGTIAHRSDISLAAAERELELGVRRPTEAEVTRAKEILAAAKAAGKPLTTLEEVYANETVQMAAYPATVKAKMQALRVGDLGIAAIPCETFVEIGLAIKSRSPLKPTFTISLANGYNGYLPTPEQHKLGGYETWRAKSSYLEVDAATRITATILELLETVAKK